MFKKLLIGGLVLIVAVAIGASAYNVYAQRNVDTQKNAQTSEYTEASVEQSSEHSFGQRGEPDWNQTTDPALPNDVPTDTTPDISEYGNTASESPDTANQTYGQGNRYGQSRGRGQGKGSGTGSGNTSPAPQNSFQEWVSLEGIVSAYSPPEFILITNDNKTITAEIGNISYAENIGLTINDGDHVTVTGFYDANDAFTVGQITLQSSGMTYMLRDELGRPNWAGGNS
jgi:hypothetical protein